MKKRAVILAGLLTITGILAGSTAANVHRLSGHWAASAVGVLHAAGVVEPQDLVSFDPDAPLTRAALAKLLVLGTGHGASVTDLRETPSRFADVPASHWGRAYIEAAAELGLLEGFPGGTFQPDQPVTRDQFAVIAIRTLGLGSRARTLRFEPTAFTDDPAIPSWARGEIALAVREELLMGVGDGRFEPTRPITRAEGTAGVLRLLGRRGGLVHLTGTLLRVDPVTGNGRLRDPLGNEHPFTLHPGAAVLRQGVPAPPDSLRALDQVWLILDSAGRATFLEARSEELQVSALSLQGGRLHFTHPSGATDARSVQPGALLYLNGRPAALAELAGATDALLLLDRATGEVRAADAVRIDQRGQVVSVRPGWVTLLTDGRLTELSISPDAPFFMLGERRPLADLPAGSRVEVALNEAGAIIYLQIMR